MNSFGHALDLVLLLQCISTGGTDSLCIKVYVEPPDMKML